jgi:hypothetical protein
MHVWTIYFVSVSRQQWKKILLKIDAFAPCLFEPISENYYVHYDTLIKQVRAIQQNTPEEGSQSSAFLEAVTEELQRAN